MCAYNPGVTDISGQIRAQSMVAGTNNIAGSISDAFKEYRQNEEKRRLANSATQGILAANPEALQGLMQDPAMAKLWGRKQSGKSNLSDDLQFAGALSAYGKAKEEKTAQQFREMQLKREQDVEQKKADGWKAIQQMSRNGYEGVDSVTAGVLQDFVEASQLTGKTADPDTLMKAIQVAKAEAAKAEALQLKAETAAGAGEIITGENGGEYTRRIDGSLSKGHPAQKPPAVQKMEPLFDPVSGRTFIWDGGQYKDKQTGEPKMLRRSDPVTGETTYRLNPKFSLNNRGKPDDAISEDELDSIAGAPSPAGAPAPKAAPAANASEASRFRVIRRS